MWNWFGILITLPFATVGAFCIWVSRLIAGDTLRQFFANRIGKDDEPEPEDMLMLSYPESWFELGVYARDLFDAECIKRRISPDVEVTETEVDVEGQKVIIHFRLMNPDEDCADLRNAMAQEGGFEIHPTIQAHIDSKRFAMEKKFHSRRIREMRN